MTDSEKKEMLRALCGLSEEQLPDSSLWAYLNIAKTAILRRKYQIVTDSYDALDILRGDELLQVQMANELVAKIGGEGEIVHIENGVHRHYDDAFISSSLLKQIVPYGTPFGSTPYIRTYEAFEGNGEQTVFVLLHTPVEVTSVTVDRVETPVELDGMEITFASAPSNGARIIVGYNYR